MCAARRTKATGAQCGSALTGQGNALLQENCRDMFRRLERMMTRLERQGERTPAQVIEAFNYLADAMEEEFGSP